MTEPTPPFRAEHIGSLIRPDALIEAREQLLAGKSDAAALKSAEDAAIREVVAMQEEIGLQIVTDGEYRRNTYSDSFTSAALDGVEIQFTEDDGWKASSQLLQFSGRNQTIQVPNLCLPEKTWKPSMAGSCTKVGEISSGASKDLGRC